MNKEENDNLLHFIIMCLFIMTIASVVSMAGMWAVEYVVRIDEEKEAIHQQRNEAYQKEVQVCANNSHSVDVVFVDCTRRVKDRYEGGL